jgi:voltage-gated potassium channel
MRARRTDEAILKTPLGRTLEYAVVAAAVATLPLALAHDMQIPSHIVQFGDWVVWLVFVLEYTIMLAMVRDRASYVRRHKLNVLVIILTFPLLPQLMGIAGAARLSRIGGLLRMSAAVMLAARSMRGVLGRPGMLGVFAASLMLIILGAFLIRMLEPQTVHDNMGNSLWWAIVTASTVGYGDISPTTFWGRVVAVILMVAGIGLISTVSGSIAAYFVDQDEGKDIDRVERRLARIEAHLARLASPEPTAAPEEKESAR